MEIFYTLFPGLGCFLVIPENDREHIQHSEQYRRVNTERQKAEKRTIRQFKQNFKEEAQFDQLYVIDILQKYWFPDYLLRTLIDKVNDFYNDKNSNECTANDLSENPDKK